MWLLYTAHCSAVGWRGITNLGTYTYFTYILLQIAALYVHHTSIGVASSSGHSRFFNIVVRSGLGTRLVQTVGGCLIRQKGSQWAMCTQSQYTELGNYCTMYTCTQHVPLNGLECVGHYQQTGHPIIVRYSQRCIQNNIIIGEVLGTYSQLQSTSAMAHQMLQAQQYVF